MILTDRTNLTAIESMDKQALLDGETRERESSIVVYSSRWWTLAIFSLLSMSTATMWVTFAPISDDTSVFFDDVGNTAVNMLAVIFQIFYPPGTYLCVLCMKKYGLRANLLIGGLLSLVGAVVRVIAVAYRYELGATLSYAFIFIGQSIAALAQPMFVNVPAAVAAKWFPVKEREIATTIASLFNPLGNAFGQVLPPMFVKETDDGGVTGMRDLMICEAIVVFIPLCIAFAFFKSEPPSPPSHSARLKTTVGNVDIDEKSSNNKVMNEFWLLMENRDYLILLLSFSVGLGLFNSILTLIYQIISPYGYSNDDAGTFGAVLIVCGLVGAAVTGFSRPRSFYHVTDTFLDLFSRIFTRENEKIQDHPERRILYCSTNGLFLLLYVVFGQF